MVAPLRAAVIGLGVGAQHAQSYQEIPGVQVTWLCDTDEKRLNGLADRLGVAGRTTNWRELVGRDDIDMVSVCTPDHQHFEQAIAFVQADKHVFAEKPMTTDFGQAVELTEQVYIHGVLLAVGNVCRFMQPFAVAAEMARQGELGDLFFVEADYIHDMRDVFKRSAWRIDPQCPQSAIFGGGVHPIDLVRWAAGEVVEVYACGNHKTVPEYNAPDNILISLRFANGCIGKVWITFGVQQRPHNLIPFRIYGSKGTVHADTQHSEVRLFIDGMIAGQSGWATIPLAPQVSKPILAELEQFVDCVRNNRRPLVDVVQGARTVAIMEAAQRSLESGQPVTVPKLPPLRQLFMARSLESPLPMPELPAGYVLRTFQPGDEAHWLRICRPEFGSGWTEESLHKQILDKPWFKPEHMFFATYQGDPVGVAVAFQDSLDETETGNLHYIAVQPEHRGKRLGQALIAAVGNCLRERGFKRYRLSTDDFRWQAIKSYWASGFRPDDVRSEFEQKRWQDVMRRLVISE